MTETMKAPKPAPAKPPDDGIRVKKLHFVHQGGVDLPSEQRRASITTTPTKDGWLYEILFVPRIGMYHVRAFSPRGSNEKFAEAPMHTFLIPREWATAEMEAQ